MLKTKSKTIERPINKHQTESWADIDRFVSEANVPIPSEEAVINAKEWVDENEL